MRGGHIIPVEAVDSCASGTTWFRDEDEDDILWLYLGLSNHRAWVIDLVVATTIRSRRSCFGLALG